MEEARHSHFSRQNLRTTACAAFAYLVIAAILFWPVVSGIMNTVVNGGGDVYQSLWGLWWVPYSILTLHSSPYFSSMIYYPVGASLVTQTLMPIAGLLSAPLQAIGLTFSYNIIFLLGFALSGFFMYLLAFRLTRNVYASFIAGMIFAFSPMHIAQSYGHLNWTTIEFLPLFVLMLIQMIEDSKLKYAAGAAISFVLLVFMGDPEQGIMTVLFSIILLAAYLLRKDGRKMILSRGFAVNFSAMVVLVLVLGSPFLIPIINGIVSGNALATANQLADLQHNMIWSQNIVSFFIPSPYNSFLSSASQFSSTIYAPDPTERIAYLGYVALFLALLGIYYDYKRDRLKNSALWIVMIVVFGLLSLGPYLQIGSTVSQIPGPFLGYRYIPIFNIIREPGRFDLIVTMALAVLAALGFNEVLKHEKVQGHKIRNNAIYATAIISILIIIEYNGILIPGHFPTGWFITVNASSAYSQIRNVTGNYTVLMLPDTVNVTSPALYPGMSEYFQTIFQKPIVGGYTSRTTSMQTYSVELLPISMMSGYLEEGYGFIYPSPVITNVTAVNLLLLAVYKVKFISIIKQAYNTSDLYQLYGYLISMLGSPVYNSNSTTVFSTDNAIYHNAGRSVVAYTGDASAWIPGFVLCGQYNPGQQCNPTVYNAWWGNSTRSVIIYAPANQTGLIVNFSAAAFVSNPVLYVYLNSPQDLVDKVSLNTTLRHFSVPVNVSPTFNQLVFYMSNSTFTQPLDSVLNFGLENITVEQRHSGLPGTSLPSGITENTTAPSQPNATVRRQNAVITNSTPSNVSS